jgi:hypothetical protein
MTADQYRVIAVLLMSTEVNPPLRIRRYRRIGSLNVNVDYRTATDTEETGVF